MTLNPELNLFLEETVANLNIEDRPYFRDLSSGKITKSEFIQSQIEFSHLVSFFSRPMATAIGNIPNPYRRMKIVENLWEEHGNGVAEKVHGKTILTLIDRLGGDSSKIDDSSLMPNVITFNQALRGASAFEDYRFATAAFSGIERSFVDISTVICNAIVNNGWLPADKVTHYALHKEIDIQHAKDFLSVANDDWVNPVHRQLIKKGIVFGANLFTDTYSAFYENIKKRPMNEPVSVDMEYSI